MTTDQIDRQLEALENLNKNQMIQNKETSQALADLGDTLNLGLEKIAKALPKQVVITINLQRYYPQMTFWCGRWWCWNGYGWI